MWLIAKTASFWTGRVSTDFKQQCDERDPPKPPLKRGALREEGKEAVVNIFEIGINTYL